MLKINNIFKDELLIGNFLSNLFYSIAYPTIHFILISDATEKLISANQIIICFAGIIFPIIWNQKSDRLYKKYGYLLSLEGILYSLLIIAILFSIITPRMYYLVDTILFSILTKNIICGLNKLKIYRYKGNTREEYDNNVNIVCNISSLIGFSISLIVSISKNIAFIFMGIGIVLDNIFYYKAYKLTLSVKEE